MLDDTEKKIYNTYLRAQAEHHKRPYKIRKDFSRMSEANKLHLKKLKLFFEQYKDVNPFKFFQAGFKYENSTYPTLDFYNSLRAVRLYSRYLCNKYEESADNEESLKDFKDGILFIYNFIAEQDITLADYKTCVNENGVPWVVIHLKRQNISFYHLHSLEVGIDIFPKDYRELITDNFEEIFYETRETYRNSKMMKEIGDKFNKFSHRLLKATRKNSCTMNLTAGGTDSSSEG